MRVTLQFQRFSEDTNRPLDYAMNNERMEFADFSSVPVVGDYIEFSTEESGEQGLFYVKSRLITYYLRDGEWSADVNVVVQADQDNVRPQILKE